MITREQLYCIGKIGAPHGTKGELTLIVRHDFECATEPTFIVLEIDALFVPFRIVQWRETGHNDILQLKWIETPQDANAFVHCPAFLFRDDLASTDDDEQNLIGWEILDMQGKCRGRVKSVDNTTSNTLFELESGEILPFHEDFVVQINDDERSIILNLPQGL